MTLLLNLGVPPQVVRDIVDHSDIEVTMTIYAHVSLDDKRNTLGKLGDALGRINRPLMPRPQIRTGHHTVRRQSRIGPQSGEHPGDRGSPQYDIHLVLLEDGADDIEVSRVGTRSLE